MKNRAWIFCRINNDLQSPTSLSFLKAQEEGLRHFCMEHNLKVVGVSYIWGRNTNELVPKAADHVFDLLLVKSVSRLSRDIKTVIETGELLREYGVGIFFVQENAASPLALEHLYESIEAYQESENTADPLADQGGLTQ